MRAIAACSTDLHAAIVGALQSALRSQLFVAGTL